MNGFEAMSKGLEYDDDLKEASRLIGGVLDRAAREGKDLPDGIGFKALLAVAKLTGAVARADRDARESKDPAFNRRVMLEGVNRMYAERK